ncbi:putative dehydrogenase [Kribbella amoyensis]|uniref:Putative dehydrogenase n=1 Tax=Kribbella amoyensis TaxID=996641 RepID=A0A561C0J1_9ACTN|nr:Gfo/Idh/MocA family oxidoreductase [Kribbella amoyensis]TWD84671.1 putative dehydrogenase [Kribbella amoyensis]
MIRLAVAGTAHPHVEYVLSELAHQPNVQLVGISEPDPAAAQRYTGGLDVPTYTSHEELLDTHDVDAVAVCGEYGARADVVVAALQRGAHVLADKPLCTTLDDLDRIDKAARTADRLVSIMFEKRGHPVTIAARQLVEDGVLGDLALVASTGPHKLNRESRPAWFFDRTRYGGILGDLPVHDIDLVLALSGARAGSVAGRVGNRSLPEYPGFSDNGAVLLGADGVTATIEAHWMWPAASAYHGQYRMRLTGTSGTAELDWALGTLAVVTRDRDVHHPELGAPVRPAEDFLTALVAGRHPEVGTADSLVATRIALLAQLSADTGGVPQNWSR